MTAERSQFVTISSIRYSIMRLDTGTPYLDSRELLPVGLVQELHLQHDARVHLGGERQAGDDDCPAIVVRKVQPFAGLDGTEY